MWDEEDILTAIQGQVEERQSRFSSMKRSRPIARREGVGGVGRVGPVTPSGVVTVGIRLWMVHHP